MRDPATTAAERHNYVEVRLGELRLAVPTACARSALPRPSALLPLGQPHPCLLGASLHQGRAVPLVDARGLLGLPAAAPCAQVLVLAQHGRQAALAVDSVCGLLSLSAAQVTQLRHDDNAEAFFRLIATPADGSPPLSVLEPERLMVWTQAWGATGDDDAAGRAGLTDGAVAGGGAVALATFTVAGRQMALPATMVTEVLQAPAVSPLPGGQLIGVTLWRGRHVGVLRADLLGTPSTPPALLAVLERDGRYLGLPVAAALALTAVPCATLEAGLHPQRGDSLVKGTISVGDAPCLLLDDDRLMAMAPSLAAATPPPATRHHRNRDAYVVCDAGGALAVPMSAIAAILALPADFQRTAPTPDGRIGTCAWNGRQIPVVALAAERTSQPHLIVLDRGDDCIALSASRLVRMILADSSTTRHYSQFGAAPQPLIIVDAEAGEASYRLLDVAAL